MSEKMSANVPQAARRQIREANRIMQGMQNPPPAPPAGNDASVPTNLPVIDLQPVPQNQTPDRPQPKSQAAQASAPAPSPQAAAPPSELEQANHRYQVLNGKYTAETSRLLGAAQALQDENNRLMRRLEEARLPHPAQPTARPEDQFDLSAVTPKEREEYGEELVQLMARIAKANSGKEIAALQRELQQMRGQVQQGAQHLAQTSNERIWAALNAWNPSWSIINTSQEFLDWLDVPDIISGLARKTGLENAFSTGNAQRVVAIFQAYMQEDSRARSGATNTPAPPQVNRSDLIAPGQPRGGSGEAPNGQGGRLWSENEIDDFYSRVQRKRISPEEQKATEIEIQKALMEGRIVPRHNHAGISNNV